MATNYNITDKYESWAEEKSTWQNIKDMAGAVMNWMWDAITWEKDSRIEQASSYQDQIDSLVNTRDTAIKNWSKSKEELDTINSTIKELEQKRDDKLTWSDTKWYEWYDRAYLSLNPIDEEDIYDVVKKTAPDSANKDQLIADAKARSNGTLTSFLNIVKESEQDEIEMINKARGNKSWDSSANQGFEWFMQDYLQDIYSGINPYNMTLNTANWPVTLFKEDAPQIVNSMLSDDILNTIQNNYNFIKKYEEALKSWDEDKIAVLEEKRWQDNYKAAIDNLNNIKEEVQYMYHNYWKHNWDIFHIESAFQEEKWRRMFSSSNYTNLYDIDWWQILNPEVLTSEDFGIIATNQLALDLSTWEFKASIEWKYWADSYKHAIRSLIWMTWEWSILSNAIETGIGYTTAYAQEWFNALARLTKYWYTWYKRAAKSLGYDVDMSIYDSFEYIWNQQMWMTSLNVIKDQLTDQSSFVNKIYWVVDAAPDLLVQYEFFKLTDKALMKFIPSEKDVLMNPSKYVDCVIRKGGKEYVDFLWKFDAAFEQIWTKWFLKLKLWQFVGESLIQNYLLSAAAQWAFSEDYTDTDMFLDTGFEFFNAMMLWRGYRLTTPKLKEQFRKWFWSDYFIKNGLGISDEQYRRMMMMDPDAVKELWENLDRTFNQWLSDYAESKWITVAEAYEEFFNLYKDSKNQNWYKDAMKQWNSSMNDINNEMLARAIKNSWDPNLESLKNKIEKVRIEYPDWSIWYKYKFVKDIDDNEFEYLAKLWNEETDAFQRALSIKNASEWRTITKVKNWVKEHVSVKSNVDTSKNAEFRDKNWNVDSNKVEEYKDAIKDKEEKWWELIIKKYQWSKERIHILKKTLRQWQLMTLFRQWEYNKYADKTKEMIWDVSYSWIWAKDPEAVFNERVDAFVNELEDFMEKLDKDIEAWEASWSYWKHTRADVEEYEKWFKKKNLVNIWLKEARKIHKSLNTISEKFYKTVCSDKSLTLWEKNEILYAVLDTEKESLIHLKLWWDTKIFWSSYEKTFYIWNQRWSYWGKNWKPKTQVVWKVKIVAGNWKTYEYKYYVNPLPSTWGWYAESINIMDDDWKMFMQLKYQDGKLTIVDKYDVDKLWEIDIHFDKNKWFDRWRFEIYWWQWKSWIKRIPLIKSIAAVLWADFSWWRFSNAWAIKKLENLIDKLKKWVVSREEFTKNFASTWYSSLPDSMLTVPFSYYLEVKLKVAKWIISAWEWAELIIKASMWKFREWVWYYNIRGWSYFKGKEIRRFIFWNWGYIWLSNKMLSWFIPWLDNNKRTILRYKKSPEFWDSEFLWILEYTDAKWTTKEIWLMWIDNSWNLTFAIWPEGNRKPVSLKWTMTDAMILKEWLIENVNKVEDLSDYEFTKTESQLEFIKAWKKANKQAELEWSYEYKFTRLLNWDTDDSLKWLTQVDKSLWVSKDYIKEVWLVSALKTCVWELLKSKKRFSAKKIVWEYLKQTFLWNILTWFKLKSIKEVYEIIGKYEKSWTIDELSDLVVNIWWKYYPAVKYSDTLNWFKLWYDPDSDILIFEVNWRTIWVPWGWNRNVLEIDWERYLELNVWTENIYVRLDATKWLEFDIDVNTFTKRQEDLDLLNAKKEATTWDTLWDELQKTKDDLYNKLKPYEDEWENIKEAIDKANSEDDLQNLMYSLIEAPSIKKISDALMDVWKNNNIVSFYKIVKTIKNEIIPELSEAYWRDVTDDVCKYLKFAIDPSDDILPEFLKEWGIKLENKSEIVSADNIDLFKERLYKIIELNETHEWKLTWTSYWHNNQKIKKKRMQKVKEWVNNGTYKTRDALNKARKAANRDTKPSKIRKEIYTKETNTWEKTVTEKLATGSTVIENDQALKKIEKMQSLTDLLTDTLNNRKGWFKAIDENSGWEMFNHKWVLNIMYKLLQEDISVDEAISLVTQSLYIKWLDINTEEWKALFVEYLSNAKWCYDKEWKFVNLTKDQKEERIKDLLDKLINWSDWLVTVKLEDKWKVKPETEWTNKVINAAENEAKWWENVTEDIWTKIKNLQKDISEWTAELETWVKWDVEDSLKVIDRFNQTSIDWFNNNLVIQLVWAFENLEKLLKDWKIKWETANRVKEIIKSYEEILNSKWIKIGRETPTIDWWKLLYWFKENNNLSIWNYTLKIRKNDSAKEVDFSHSNIQKNSLEWYRITLEWYTIKEWIVSVEIPFWSVYIKMFPWYIIMTPDIKTCHKLFVDLLSSKDKLESFLSNYAKFWDAVRNKETYVEFLDNCPDEDITMIWIFLRFDVDESTLSDIVLKEAKTSDSDSIIETVNKANEALWKTAEENDVDEIVEYDYVPTDKDVLKENLKWDKALISDDEIKELWIDDEAAVNSSVSETEWFYAYIEKDWDEFTIDYLQSTKDWFPLWFNKLSTSDKQKLIEWLMSNNYKWFINTKEWLEYVAYSVLMWRKIHKSLFNNMRAHFRLWQTWEVKRIDMLNAILNSVWWAKIVWTDVKKMSFNDTMHFADYDYIYSWARKDSSEMWIKTSNWWRPKKKVPKDLKNVKQYWTRPYKWQWSNDLFWMYFKTYINNCKELWFNSYWKYKWPLSFYDMYVLKNNLDGKIFEDLVKNPNTLFWENRSIIMDSLWKIEINKMLENDYVKIDSRKWVYDIKKELKSSLANFLWDNKNYSTLPVIDPKNLKNLPDEFILRWKSLKDVKEAFDKNLSKEYNIYWSLNWEMHVAKKDWLVDWVKWEAQLTKTAEASENIVKDSKGNPKCI